MTPVIKCDMCKGSGCRSCDNFGHVLTDEAAAQVKAFWSEVPTIKIESMRDFEMCFGEAE